jgi:hypothetical protein
MPVGSTRDIEVAFADETGQSVLSKSAVSEATELLWQQYGALARRDLRVPGPVLVCNDPLNCCSGHNFEEISSRLDQVATELAMLLSDGCDGA